MSDRRKRFDEWAIDYDPSLVDLCVVEVERRRGYGATIVGALLTWAAEAGARIAYLQAQPERPGACALPTAWIRSGVPVPASSRAVG